MKHESRTIGQSRTWAHDLCGRLERWARCFEYWDQAVEDSKNLYFWQVKRRWGCGRKRLLARRQDGINILLDSKL